MKKLFTAILVIAVAAVFVFAGCGGGDKGESGKSGNVILDVTRVVFTASDEVTALTETTSVKEYMDVLEANGELVYGISNGFIDYFYNTESKVISSTVNSYEGYDWAFYIDFTTLEGDGAIYATDYKTYEYGGKTFYSSSNGVTDTPCIDGHTYIFVYEYSNMSF